MRAGWSSPLLLNFSGAPSRTCSEKLQSNSSNKLQSSALHLNQDVISQPFVVRGMSRAAQHHRERDRGHGVRVGHGDAQHLRHLRFYVRRRVYYRRRKRCVINDARNHAKGGQQYTLSPGFCGEKRPLSGNAYIRLTRDFALTASRTLLRLPQLANIWYFSAQTNNLFDSSTPNCEAEMNSKVPEKGGCYSIPLLLIFTFFAGNRIVRAVTSQRSRICSSQGTTTDETDCDSGCSDIRFCKN